jgi:ferredoxin-thioredoxin reductase catalytic subunit
VAKRKITKIKMVKNRKVKAEFSEDELNLEVKRWKEFADRKKDKEFILNPDSTKVKSLAKGVLHNEKTKGLKFCPCRMTTKEREKDLKLICPCNFKIQKTWLEKGECWCGLFIKRKE